MFLVQACIPSLILHVSAEALSEHQMSADRSQPWDTDTGTGCVCSQESLTPTTPGGRPYEEFLLAVLAQSVASTNMELGQLWMLCHCREDSYVQV